jgi:hypothetical protein
MKATDGAVAARLAGRIEAAAISLGIWNESLARLGMGVAQALLILL